MKNFQVFNGFGGFGRVKKGVLNSVKGISWRGNGEDWKTEDFHGNEKGVKMEVIFEVEFRENGVCSSIFSYGTNRISDF